MARDYRKYTADFRESAVELLMNSGKTSDEIAENLGVPRSTLNRWRREICGEIAKPRSLKEIDSVQEELLRLRKENRQLREEREVLKKAMAFFAKDQS